jgi:GNAT superfamily N-acetyltransferase
MIVQFTCSTELPKGQVYPIISAAWAEIWDAELEKKVRQFDKEVYEYPATVGACTFITTLEDAPVGMFSWDPRGYPDVARIGWNCVLPQHRRLGIGKMQVLAMLSRFRQRNFARVCVTTGDHPFFVPAQKMYLKCGFAEVSRRTIPGQPYGRIDYELSL